MSHFHQPYITAPNHTSSVPSVLMDKRKNIRGKSPDMSGLSHNSVDHRSFLSLRNEQETRAAETVV